MESKKKLTGGTLVVIALIVMIFGDTRSGEIVKKLDSVQSSVSGIEYEVEELRLEVSKLAEENEKLRKELLLAKTHN